MMLCLQFLRYGCSSLDRQKTVCRDMDVYALLEGRSIKAVVVMRFLLYVHYVALLCIKMPQSETQPSSASESFGSILWSCSILI